MFLVFAVCRVPAVRILHGRAGARPASLRSRSSASLSPSRARRPSAFTSRFRAPSLSIWLLRAYVFRGILARQRVCTARVTYRGLIISRSNPAWQSANNTNSFGFAAVFTRRRDERHSDTSGLTGLNDTAVRPDTSFRKCAVSNSHSAESDPF